MSTINHTIKRAVIFASCQGEPLARALRYRGIEVSTYQSWYEFNCSEPSKALKDDLQKCDLFIAHVFNDRPGWSITALQGLMPATCLFVKFPYLYFTGYWVPSNETSQFNERTKSSDAQFGLFPYPYFTLSSVEETLAFREAIEVSEGRVRESLDELLARSVDSPFLHVAQYVSDNYRSTRCFDTPNHPSKIITDMCVAALLLHIGRKQLSSRELLPAVGLEILPILPTIHENLQLTFDGSNSRMVGKETGDARFFLERYFKTRQAYT